MTIIYWLKSFIAKGSKNRIKWPKIWSKEKNRVRPRLNEMRPMREKFSKKEDKGRRREKKRKNFWKNRDNWTINE